MTKHRHPRPAPVTDSAEMILTAMNEIIAEMEDWGRHDWTAIARRSSAAELKEMVRVARRLNLLAERIECRTS